MANRLWLAIFRATGLIALAAATTGMAHQVAAKCQTCDQYCYYDAQNHKICGKATCADTIGPGNVCTNIPDGGCAMSGNCVS